MKTYFETLDNNESNTFYDSINKLPEKDIKIDKVVRPCYSLVGDDKVPVYAHIQFDGKVLSLTGAVNPLREDADACGQVQSYLLNDVVCLKDLYNDDKSYDLTEEFSKQAEFWDTNAVSELYRIWKIWNLNDLRPYCSCQRDLGWRIIGDKRVTITNSITDKEEQRLLGHLTKEHHPAGLLGEPCPKCGYKYGSQWLKEEIPNDVIEWLDSLLEVDEVPKFFR